METDKRQEMKIPVIEEQLSIDKALVTTGSLHVKKTVEDAIEPVSALLASESYEVQRMPKNEILQQLPEGMVHQGDRIIIPVVEERIVVEKRLVLVEEIHLIRKQTQREYKDEISVRKEKVTIERKKMD